ncbi:glycosyl hydrolase family 8 [uncultured Desulfobacter sp.]|uniref:glycosyl hydrolase family 8 n=1 Tax=uncultured Desulfobacter sp. TaxID=240139 RepID=UPI0029C99393|nr:glycosyl hydrolase family 8 [uncultured Desulfobacter sp.]
MNKLKTACLLTALGCCLVLAGPCFADAPGTWEYYRSHFVSKDGRVIDFFQKKTSHSEGQGYGMLLAVAHKDRASFNRIYKWTRENLMVRTDPLSTWQWGMRINGQWNILDYNNATDGDLLIAWALLDASELWSEPDLAAHALSIIAAIKNALVIKKYGRMVLLPGYFGFSSPEAVILNPSYFVYPAFEKFAQIDNPKFWHTLAAHSVELTFGHSLTPLELPCDWISMNENGVKINEKRSKNFGYEAIRIPLYMAMSDEHKNGLTHFSKYLSFYKTTQLLPNVVDLVDNQISMFMAPAGFYAVFARCCQVIGEKKLSSQLMETAEKKILTEKDDYYSNTLYLLARSVNLP